MWQDRALGALARLGRPQTADQVVVEVAVEFADRFEPTDRAYVGGVPAWHLAVRAALDALIEQGLVTVARRRLSLSETGARQRPRRPPGWRRRRRHPPSHRLGPGTQRATSSSRRRGPGCPTRSPE